MNHPAAPPNLRALEVTFPSGPNVLAGTLTLPPEGTPGPFPALIYLGGSERAERGKPFAPGEDVAAHGIAHLRFDFPGTGRSTGERTQPMADRVRDARAATALLRAHPEINPRGVGLSGGSQGAIIAYMAAAEDADLAFIVCSSGPGVTLPDQMRYCMTNHGQEYELGGEDRERVLLLWEVFYDVGLRKKSPAAQAEAIRAHGPTMRRIDLVVARAQVADWRDAADWEPLFALLEDAHSAECLAAAHEVIRRWDAADLAWLRCAHAQRWGLKVDMLLENLRGTLDCYDVAPPADYLRRVRCPVFAFFGAKDTCCPARQDLAIFAEALAAGGNPDFLLQMLPHGHCPPMAAHLPVVMPWIRQRFGPTVPR